MKNLQQAKLLTGYAVEIRYPGDYEPVDEAEYIRSVEIAEKVLKWVKEKVEIE